MYSQEVPVPAGINDSGCLLGDTDLFDAEQEEEDEEEVEEESLEAIRAAVKQKAKKHKVRHLCLLVFHLLLRTHFPSYAHSHETIVVLFCFSYVLCLCVFQAHLEDEPAEKPQRVVRPLKWLLSQLVIFLLRLDIILCIVTS